MNIGISVGLTAQQSAGGMSVAEASRAPLMHG